MAFKTWSFFSNALRAKEMATALIRNGFAELIDQLDIPSNWLSKVIPKREQKLNIWERIRVTCEDLGPTFIKFAQVLSTRPDVLPQPLIQELKKLRKQARPLPFEDMNPILIEEIGGPIDSLFSQFETTPAASASLGQVYRAVLKKTQAEVAVKIQRPNIIRAMKADIEIITWFAKKIHERIPHLKPYDLPSLVQEIANGIMKELDFNNEARNANYFNTINPYPQKVFAPSVYEDLSTRRVLISEWIDGTSPEDTDLNEKERTVLAENGAQSVFHQISIAGFFHSDPHGGNILITKDLRLCFLDWGLVGHLTRKMRYFLADLFAAITALDNEKVVQIATAKAIGKVRVDESKLEKEVSFILRKYQDLNLHKVPFGRLFIELLFILSLNGIHLARDYALLGKSVMAIEDVGKSLQPNFDIKKTAAPFLKKLSWERWSLKSFLRQGYWSLQIGLNRLRDFPSTAQRLLRTLEEGRLNIGLHHKGLDSLEKTLSTVVNRLVLSIIIGALVIGSSMIITTGVEPFIWGYPSIGIVGFLLSAFFGLYLVWDIFRHGRHK